MFQTDASWEIADPAGVRRALSGQPGFREYHIIELGLNLPVYHVAVVLPEEHKWEQVLRRFRFEELMAALNFIEAKVPVLVRLVQETPFSANSKSELRAISSVSTAVNENGQSILLIETDLGCFRVGYEADEPVGTVSDVTQIWPKLASPV